MKVYTLWCTSKHPSQSTKSSYFFLLIRLKHCNVLKTKYYVFPRNTEIRFKCTKLSVSSSIEYSLHKCLKLRRHLLTNKKKELFSRQSYKLLKSFISNKLSRTNFSSHIVKNVWKIIKKRSTLQKSFLVKWFNWTQAELNTKR